MASSLQLVTPSGIAPARFNRATGGASTPEITTLLLSSPVEFGMPEGKREKDREIWKKPAATASCVMLLEKGLLVYPTLLGVSLSGMDWCF